MKTLTNLTRALLVFLAATGLALALSANNANAESQTVVQIEFLRLEDGDFDPSTLAEIRNLHEQLMTDRNIYAWYDYTVRFPFDARSPYNHVIVTVFADSAFIRDRNRAMPPIGRLVRRERAFPDYAMRSPGYETTASPYISVNFYRADLANAELQTQMRVDWEPWLDGRFIESGRWMTWSRFDMPHVRRSDGYNFVIVARHAGFAAAEAQIDMPPALADHVVLRRAEVWRLNAILLPSLTDASS